MENMINVTNSKCIHDNYNKQPIFNVPTEKNGIYCREHKMENMVDVKHKRCIHNNCNKRPHFNVPIKKKGNVLF